MFPIQLSYFRIVFAVIRLEAMANALSLQICKKQIASVHVEDRLYYFKIIYPPMGIETSTVMAFGRPSEHF